MNAAFTPFPGAGWKLLENRMIGTRDVFEWCGEYVVVHSYECLLQLERGVLWHDGRQHCPTWTDAAECRCDVEVA